MADYGGQQADWVVAPHEGWVAPKGRTPDGRVLADQGRRTLGFLVDLLIWLVPQIVVLGALGALFFASIDSATTTNEVTGTEELSGGSVALLALLYGSIFVLAIVRMAVEAELLARHGQTWGMRALKLRVVDAKTGGPVTRGRAWARGLFGVFVSAQLCYFGYWWSFFDNRKRTLHDLIVTTVVIDER
jgi:uncharacterized RDD family membrane protein YckC